jgi:alpha-tubulin suppressor-like RCC1 family protein
MSSQLFIHHNVKSFKDLSNYVDKSISVITPNTILSDYFDNNVTRVGFLWTNTLPVFPFGDRSPLTVKEQSFKFFTKGFYYFVKRFTNQVRIDLMSTNLNNDKIKNEINQLSQLLPNLDIQYSLKIKNNISTLESNNEQIGSFYFGINQITPDIEIPSNNNTVIIKKDDTVWAAGDNSYNQLGRTDIVDSSTFIKIFKTRSKSKSKPISAVAGPQNIAILLDDGTVWMAGDNSDNQMGNIGTPTKFVQVYPIKGKPKYKKKAVQVSISGIRFTLILLKDGTVIAAGVNVVGQLGLGETSANVSDFTQIYPTVGQPSNDGEKAIKIASGSNQASILLKNGTLRMAGLDDMGQFGNGIIDFFGDLSFYYFNQVYPLSGNLPDDNKKAVDVSEGFGHTILLLENGQVLTTGLNYNSNDDQGGQLGYGFPWYGSYVFTPAYPTEGKTIDDHKVKLISAGDYFSSIVKEDGLLLNAGDNSDGQLGNGMYNEVMIFSEIDIKRKYKVKEIKNGASHSVLLINDSLYVAGNNNSGQLGNDSFVDSSEYIKVMDDVKTIL